MAHRLRFAPHRLTAAIALFAAIDACSGAPLAPAPPPDRDGLSRPLGQACKRMRDVGCSDGREHSGRTCYERLVGRAPIVVIPIDCLADASDLAAVRGCGGPDTLRFRCL